MSSISNFVRNVNKGQEVKTSYQNVVRIGYPDAPYSATPSFQLMKVKNKEASLSSNACLATGEGCKLSNGKITSLESSDKPEFVVLGKNQEVYSYIPATASDSNILYDIYENSENVNILPIGEGCNDEDIVFYMPVSETIEEGDKLKYNSDNITLSKATTAGDVVYFKAINKTTNGVVKVKRFYEVLV